MLPTNQPNHHQTIKPDHLLTKLEEEEEEEEEAATDRLNHQIEIVDHHQQLRSRSSTLPSSIHRTNGLLNKRLPFTELLSPGLYSNSFSFQQDSSCLDLELDPNHPHQLEQIGRAHV